MRLHGALTGLAVLLWASAPASTAAEPETYSGTVAAADGAPARITLTIREYTSDDRAFALAEKLHKDGPAAALAEMLKDDAGTVRLGDGAAIRAVVIRQEKTTTTRTVRVVTERPLPVGGARPGTTPPANAAGYVELQLDASGNGSGRLMTAVKPTFSAEGFVVPEKLGEEWPIANVKPGP